MFLFKYVWGFTIHFQEGEMKKTPGLLSLLLLVAASSVSASADADAVTLTPWCENSLRVRVAPAVMPPSTEAAQEALARTLAEKNMTDLAGALVDECEPGAPVEVGATDAPTVHGNLVADVSADGSISFSAADTGALLFSASATFEENENGYLVANLTVTAGDADEVTYGLGQGNWTDEGGCPAEGMDGSRIVPLERNGQSVNLMQRKFHVSIPFLYSNTGYGFLFNMPGYGNVDVGAHGVGGANWSAASALYLDFWVTGLPKEATAGGAGAIYSQYADATGHSPPLREDAMIFWQSRNRYKSTDIALDVAQRYGELDLPVGILVVDYKNQEFDGDFVPNPSCYPSVQDLSDGVREAINATTMFSFWPEVVENASTFNTLNSRGCLINADLGGLAVDATIPDCRQFIWDSYLKPNYFDQGISAYWLDETDAEGTGGGPDGNYGYNTSYGPPEAYSNLWVNDWLSLFSDPIATEEPPLVLTRGVWAGGQRHGTVLWSSDIRSTFEQLASQVPQGVHASMSGIPWWTTDVGGYGCGEQKPNNDPYTQELMIRWYQFGCFSPIFRTHGCRVGDAEPDVPPCAGEQLQPSCGCNEVWSYGNETQAILEKYIRLRGEVLKHYISELADNVTATGVPTMRPLAYEFPLDPGCRGIDDQYMLGPDLLVAPVTAQGANNRTMYFPAWGGGWENLFDRRIVVAGGLTRTVEAPIDTIPVYRRR